MNEKVLKTLEYNKILNQLSEYACSPEAKKRCLALRPITDKAQIEQLQLQTKDALSRLFRCGNLSFSGVHSVNDSLKRLEIGASLSAAELLSICSLLEAAKRVKAFSRSEKEEVPDDSLTGFFTEIEPLTPLYDEIKRCILAEDEIADDASSTLRSIRRSMRGMNDRIRAQMNNMINNSTTRSYLQDAVITMRDGRYCLPVKAEAKSQIPGMVHDQSSTGSTFFVEPMAVVKLNNDIRELEIEEAKEIEVILSTLSAQADLHRDEIRYDLENMVELDFIFARAALAMEQNANEPIFNTEGKIHLRKARHPLINAKKVVVEEIAGKFNDSQSAVVVEYRGLSVAEVTELRKSLREEDVEFKVYKNKLVQRATESAGYAEINDKLVGPNAIAFGHSDAVAPARILANFAKDHEALVIKAGIVEGKVLEVEEYKN